MKTTGKMIDDTLIRANGNSMILANYKHHLQELEANDSLLNVELFAEGRRNKRKNQQIMNVKT